MTSKIKDHKKASKSARKAGLSPGSMVYIGDEYQGDTEIHLIQYDPSSVTTKKITSDNEIKASINPAKVNWLNITGIHNAGVIERTGELFGIHPLILEDILNTHQRPKLEVYDEFLFINLKFVDPHPDINNTISFEQISIIVGDHYLISFQEFQNDSFKPIRKRIDRESSRLRSKGIDYLFSTCIDLIVDYYLIVLDGIGDEIQVLEDKIYDRPQQEHLQSVMSIKRNLLNLRKIILPIKDSLLKIKSLESDLIDPKNKIFFEDITDHLSTVQESLDLYIELNKSLRESYISSLGFKTNEVMKLLTIISTLFIPLTFIVGVYGMNFDYMPELSWSYGYFFIWTLMIIITISLIIYFKRRKWL